jgi:hypothetical protein
MQHLTPDERASLKALLAALDASETTLRRDLVRSEGRAGDWAIYGKLGHVYADGDGYLLCVVAGDERDQSQHGAGRTRTSNQAVMSELAAIAKEAISPNPAISPESARFGE